jgi:hypothetical protein
LTKRIPNLNRNREFAKEKAEPVATANGPAGPWLISNVGQSNMQRPLLLFLSILAGCASPLAAPSMPTIRHIAIPGFRVEVTIPSGWILGYGGFRSEIVFGDPRIDQSILQMPEGARSKSVGTFYSGVLGDFRDWDMDLSFEVIQFARPMRSAAELASYLNSYFGKPWVLETGERYLMFGPASVESHLDVELVRVESGNMRDHKELKLADRASTFATPTQIFYRRIDENLVVSVRVEHENKRHFDEAYFEQARSTAYEILSQLRVTPSIRAKEEPNQSLQPTALLGRG